MNNNNEYNTTHHTNSTVAHNVLAKKKKQIFSFITIYYLPLPPSKYTYRWLSSAK